ncbi:MAG: PH domain-containing protein, partial [Dermatophilaceae bacterium]|nr:PH domain-containing protein [Dermatophilaceae bacterium]
TEGVNPNRDLPQFEVTSDAGPAREFRNSARFIAASYLRDLRGLVPVALLLVGVLPQISWIPDTLMQWLGAALLATGVISPILVVITQAIVIADDRLVYKQGWIFPVVRRGDHSDVSAVQVDEPWHLRVLGLASVSVSFRGATHPFVLRGVDRRAAQQVEASLVPAIPRQGGTNSLDPVLPETTHTSDTSVGGEVASAFAPDRREMGATYLNNITMGVAAGFAGFELLSDLAPLIAPNLPWNDAPLRAAAVGVAAGLGVATAYVRLHGIQMNQATDGSWRIAYGLLERRRHAIVAGPSTAVRTRAGVVDMLLGTRRVTISTADLAQASGTDHLRFPALRSPRAAELVRVLTGAVVPPAPPASLAKVTCSFTCPLLAIAFLGIYSGTLGWVGVGSGVLTLAGAAAVLKLATGRVNVIGDVLHYRRWSFFGLTEDYVAGRAVHWSVRRRLPATKRGLVTLTAYPNRRLTVVFVGEASPEDLVSVGRRSRKSAVDTLQDVEQRENM